MITIGKIQISEHGQRSRLTATVRIPDSAVSAWKEKSAAIDAKMRERYRMDYFDDASNYELWFDVDSAYKYALCSERSDAFLMACLYYAMISGEDICCEVPVTDKLLYQIREYLIPVLCTGENGYRPIAIFAETAPEIDKTDCFSGTGISCGVDSFSTVLLNLKPEIPDQFKLTHLTLFNTGSLNFDGYAKEKALSTWRAETGREFSERIALGKQVAEELNLGFVDIDSNIPELYQGCFLFSHTYRNCSAVLATQKMWKNYYYASPGEGVFTDAGLNKDAGMYDSLITMSLSLNSLHFYSGGMPYKRLQKLAIIVDHPVVQKHINVCSYHTKNCGRCEKCIRTLSGLDLLGKLDQFTESFQDMSYYKSQKHKIRACIMESSEEDMFHYEMKTYMRNHHIPLDTKAKIFHYLLPLRKIWIWLHKR